MRWPGTLQFPVGDKAPLRTCEQEGLLCPRLTDTNDALYALVTHTALNDLDFLI